MICDAEFPSCRLVLTFMGVLASVNCYTTRVNLSVTLVIMVNNTWIDLTSQQVHKQTGSVHHISPCVKAEGNATATEVTCNVGVKAE